MAADIAQKLGIDSAVLRQELKHAAATRSASVKAAAEAQITDAERIVIRALASGGEMNGEPGISDRSGEDHLPDLRRQAQYTLGTEPLHIGLATESLLQTLLDAPELTDPMSLPLSDSDQRTLAAILLREDEPLTLRVARRRLCRASPPASRAPAAAGQSRGSSTPSGAATPPPWPNWCGKSSRSTMPWRS